jgi:hypothetical protein
MTPPPRRSTSTTLSTVALAGSVTSDAGHVVMADFM